MHLNQISNTAKFQRNELKIFLAEPSNTKKARNLFHWITNVKKFKKSISLMFKIKIRTYIYNNLNTL